MKLQFNRFIYTLTIFAFSILLWSCEQPKATVTELAKPLSTSPTPSPNQSPTPPPPPQTVDAKRTDLNRVVMGTAAPDFSLEDMNKKIVHLSDFRGKQFVVLVFYRGFF